MIEFYVSLAPAVKSSLIITTFLIIALTAIGLRVKRLEASDVPTGVTFLAILFVEMVNNTVSSIYKKNWRTFAPLMMTVLIYLLFANTIALVGLTAPLSNIVIAMSFSVFVFSSIQIVGFTVNNPFKRAKSLLNPLNLIGDWARSRGVHPRHLRYLLRGDSSLCILYALHHLHEFSH